MNVLEFTASQLSFVILGVHKQMKQVLIHVILITGKHFPLHNDGDKIHLMLIFFSICFVLIFLWLKIIFSTQC